MSQGEPDDQQRIFDQVEETGVRRSKAILGDEGAEGGGSRAFRQPSRFSLAGSDVRRPGSSGGGPGRAEESQGRCRGQKKEPV